MPGILCSCIELFLNTFPVVDEVPEEFVHAAFPFNDAGTLEALSIDFNVIISEVQLSAFCSNPICLLVLNDVLIALLSGVAEDFDFFCKRFSVCHFPAPLDA